MLPPHCTLQALVGPFCFGFAFKSIVDRTLLFNLVSILAATPTATATALATARLCLLSSMLLLLLLCSTARLRASTTVALHPQRLTDTLSADSQLHCIWDAEPKAAATRSARLWAIGYRHSALCCRHSAVGNRSSALSLVFVCSNCVASPKTKDRIIYECVCLYVCVRGCVCAPLPALFIHCFIKGPTCTTCMSLHVYLCVCKVCCPTNDAFVVVVVFACTNYFILHMYHKHSYVCVCVSLVTL